MDLKSPSRPLPEIQMRTATGHGPHTLTPCARWSLVIVLLHGLDCEECMRFLQQLGDVHADLAEWDAEIAIVLEQIADNASPPEFTPSIRVLVDAEHALESAARVTAPAVVLVDQWRDIRESWDAGDAHRFPAGSELVSWARFLATQCPECEGESL